MPVLGHTSTVDGVETKVAGPALTTGVPIGGGFALPASATITATAVTDLPYDLTLDLELTEGRYVCTSLACRKKPGGAPVTTEGIRRLPLSRIMAFGLQGFVVRFTKTPLLRGEPSDQLVGEPVGDWSDELTQLAGMYRLAYACGLPPTKSAADWLQIPQSTAAKKVMKARRQGLLGETTPGQAGEKG